MEQINKILAELGLSPSEIETYLSALQLGEASVFEIAHKAKLPRTTTGSILDRLQAEGLVSVYTRGNKRTYWVEPPRTLSENYRSKAVLADQLNSKIHNLYRQSEKKPRLEVFDRQAAIIKLIHKTLATLPKGSEILTWDSPRAANYLKIMSEELFRILSEQKIDKGISTRSLIPSGQENLINKKYPKPSIEVRIAPPGLNYESSVWLFNNSVVIFSGEHTFAACITNKNIKNDFASLFEFVWRQSKKIDY